MATITKSIGTDARDYSTITLWEAALAGAAGGAGNDAVGECYADSNFDETVVIDNGTPNSITLTVASGQRHDGTVGTGARIVHSANSKYVVLNVVNNLVIEWIEVDANGYIDSTHPLVSIFGGDNNKALNMLLHDRDGNAAVKGMTVRGTVHNALLANNILYNIISNNSATNAIGSGMDGYSTVVQYCYNNTVYNVTQPTGVGTSTGIKIHKNEATTHITNNISMGTASPSGTAKDFDFPGTTVDDATNMSSDDTANDGGGSGSLENKVVGDQFVSTVGGSEDLHLKSGADAIDAGTDLGTSPSGVEIDIDGRDRDSEGDTWDMGADEYMVVGGAEVYSGRGIGRGILRGVMR